MKYVTKLAWLLKFIQIMTVSKQLRSCWNPSRLAHHGDPGHSNEASLRNNIGRPSNGQLRACSNILSEELSRRPHQSHQPNVTALSSRAIFRLLFVHKIHALSSLFSIGLVKKTSVFLWAIIWPDSLKISLSDSVWRLKNLRQKCQILPYEQFQIVNHCKLWTLMVCHFGQLSSCSANQIL